MSKLLLAATSLDVTPPPGHRLDGYAARTAPATGTADPLRATLIWLGTADDPGVLWLTLDAIAVGKELVADLAAAAGAAAGIPPAHVVVSASHTHSGPSGWTGEIHPVIPAEREPELADALIAAVANASLPRRPVTASWRSIEVVGVGANRHRKNGPHDNTAGILALHSSGGSLEAVLFDFACHPTTYGPENLQWSADWPGAARDALAPAVVGFLQGAAGDVSPRFTRRGRGAAEVARLGGLLASRVREALGGPGLELPQSAPAIRRTTITLPVRDMPAPEEAASTVAAAATAVRNGLHTTPTPDTPTALHTPPTDPYAGLRTGLGNATGGTLGGAADPSTGAFGAVDDATGGLGGADGPSTGAPGGANGASGGAGGGVGDSSGGVLGGVLGGVDDPSGRIALTRLDGARGQSLMAAADLPDQLELPISVVTLGDVCWVNLPVELFALHGACLQADSTHPITRVIGYTDGYYGYIVDPSAAESGAYEALITFFDQPTTNTLLTRTATFINT
ncbi:hypothetical protein [Kribbella sp. CA-247076]|uniref:hypothetical protein n=1 Tax=Kribbella sp. CA-247076 TaxID=3239941 RepID=UPI003D925A37